MKKILLLALLVLIANPAFAGSCKKKAGYIASYSTDKNSCVYKNKFERFTYPGEFNRKGFGVRITAENTMEGSGGINKPIMTVQCTEGTSGPEMFINFGSNMICIGDEWYKVKVNNRASQRWSFYNYKFYQQEDCMTIAPDSGITGFGTLYKYFLKSKTFEITAAPQGYPAQTVKFDLAGYAAAQQHPLSKCLKLSTKNKVFEGW